MKEAGVERIEAILCTHRHYDHIGGIKSLYAEFGELPTYKFMQDGMDEYKYNSHVPDDIKWRHITDGQVFCLTADNATDRPTSLRALYTPGHSEDSVCFVLEEEGSIFAGDNVLGTGTTWFENLFDYMASLNRMLKEVHRQTKCSSEIRHPGRLYTGHGPHVEDGEAKLIAYIEHRDKREGQVLAVLGMGTTEGTSGTASSAASGAAVDAAAVAAAVAAEGAAGGAAGGSTAGAAAAGAGVGAAVGAVAGAAADSAWLTSLQVTREVYPGLDFKLFFGMGVGVRARVRLGARVGARARARVAVTVAVRRAVRRVVRRAVRPTVRVVRRG